MKREQSVLLRQRAENSIAQLAQTNSKRPSHFIDGVYPFALKRGLGAKVWDVDDNEYIDYICGLGAILFGYCNKEVNDAVRKQLNDGTIFSLPHPLECEVAEKLKARIRRLEKVRFFKNGNDATCAAVRIARTYTGRPVVLSQGYHGCGDIWVSLTQPACGVNDGFLIEPFKNLNQIDNRVACVILEPVELDFSDERKFWLRQVRELCDTNGVVLIFDEIVTGFRWPDMTVGQHWGIKPDLYCLGKALANGLPMGVCGGTKEIMDCGEWFYSQTFAGDCLSLAAANAVLSLLDYKADYSLGMLWTRGQNLLDKFHAVSGDVKITGYSSRGMFTGNEHRRNLFWQEACKAGLLFGKSLVYSFAHPEQDDMAISLIQDIFGRIDSGSVQLEGKAPDFSFRR